MSAIFDRISSQISQEAIQFVEKSTNMADQIHYILEKKRLSQKDLAEALGKKESEVSKWMTGTHNFTIKTINKIECVLGERLYFTSLEVANRISDINKTVYFAHLDSDEFSRIEFSATTENYTGTINALVGLYKKDVESANNNQITIDNKDKYFALPA